MAKSTNALDTNVKAKFFRGFSDPSRLSIVGSLRRGSLTVTEIVNVTGLSQSNVSNHLKCLRECGLVTCEKKGHYVYYELSDERVATLLGLAEELLADVAKGVAECTEYNLSDEDT